MTKKKKKNERCGLVYKQLQNLYEFELEFIDLVDASSPAAQYFDVFPFNSEYRL